MVDLLKILARRNKDSIVFNCWNSRLTTQDKHQQDTFYETCLFCLICHQFLELGVRLACLSLNVDEVNRIGIEFPCCVPIVNIFLLLPFSRCILLHSFRYLVVYLGDLIAVTQHVQAPSVSYGPQTKQTHTYSVRRKIGSEFKQYFI